MTAHVMFPSECRSIQKYRAGLRALGMRPIQLWVPDTRRPGFVEECRRQSGLLRDDPHERETLEWLSAIADTEGWQ